MADALSRMHFGEIVLMAVSAISFDLMSQIQLSWERDGELKDLVSTLQQQIITNSPYTWS